tara:strand:- start:72 stop:284 length:213 start_codon:yes stop_codon:yes gene_type:complete
MKVFKGNWRLTKQKFIFYKTRLRPIKKTKFTCSGGALDGYKLYLTTPGTMAFSINGVKGYYNSNMDWVAK